MGKILIDAEKCKGCSYCVLSCPRQLIAIDGERINMLGYNPARFNGDSGEKCTGCALCAEMCPEVVIEVYRDKKKQKEKGGAG